MNPIIQECKTLTECLHINQEALACHVFTDLSPAIFDQIHYASKLSILKRMQQIGQILYNHYGLQTGLSLCQKHASDIIRGWACFIISAASNLSIQERLFYIFPLGR